MLGFSVACFLFIQEVYTFAYSFPFQGLISSGLWWGRTLVSLISVNGHYSPSLLSPHLHLQNLKKSCLSASREGRGVRSHKCPCSQPFCQRLDRPKTLVLTFQVQILPQAALSTRGQLVVLGDMAVVADSFEELLPKEQVTSVCRFH